MIDSHCHLADEKFASELDAIVDRAKRAGLERALVILAAGDATESAQARRVETLWPEVRLSVGVHPHTAHEFARSEEHTSELQSLRHLVCRLLLEKKKI